MISLLIVGVPIEPLAVQQIETDGGDAADSFPCGGQKNTAACWARLLRATARTGVARGIDRDWVRWLYRVELDRSLPIRIAIWMYAMHA